MIGIFFRALRRLHLLIIPGCGPLWLKAHILQLIPNFKTILINMSFELHLCSFVYYLCSSFINQLQGSFMDGIKSVNKTDEVIHRHTCNFMHVTLGELLIPIDATQPTRPTLPNDL